MEKKAEVILAPNLSDYFSNGEKFRDLSTSIHNGNRYR